MCRDSRVDASFGIALAQIGDLMAQLLLPEAVRPEEVKRATAELVKVR